MPSRILVPFDPSPYAVSALEYACLLARRDNAEITGVVVLDMPGIEKSIGPVPLGGIYFAEKLEKAKEQKAHEHIELLLEKFRQICQREGVVHREAQRQGSPIDHIVQDSMFYDLVVMGVRTHFHFETEQKPGDSIELILKNAVTPIITVPEHFLPGERMNVLIAFNGSHPSAKAMQEFAYLFEPTAAQMDITLLMSETEEAIARFHLDGATSYLNAHSFRNINVQMTSDDIIQVMAEKHLQWADMVVLGVHSKKGLLDFMVGSLSRYLIKAGNKILLFGR